MANKKLIDFITAENELDGQEPVYIAQGGKTRKTLLSKIKEFIIGTTSMGTEAADVTGAVAELKGKIDSNSASLKDCVKKDNIINNCSTTTTGHVLDASQGKKLNDNTKSIYSKLRKNYYIDGNTKTVYGTAALTFVNETTMIGSITFPLAFTNTDSIKIICSAQAKNGTPFQQLTNVSGIFDGNANVNFVASGSGFIKEHTLSVDYIIIGI